MKSKPFPPEEESDWAWVTFNFIGGSWEKDMDHVWTVDQENAYRVTEMDRIRNRAGYWPNPIIDSDTMVAGWGDDVQALGVTGVLVIYKRSAHEAQVSSQLP